VAGKAGKEEAQGSVPSKKDQELDERLERYTPSLPLDLTRRGYTSLVPRRLSVTGEKSDEGEQS